jgi:hypothetical protein
VNEHTWDKAGRVVVLSSTTNTTFETVLGFCDGFVALVTRAKLQRTPAQIGEKKNLTLLSE